MQTTTTWKTMAARFPGVCRRCQGPIAVGSTMRYGGKGMTYHLAADCAFTQAAQAAAPAAQVAPQAPIVAPVTLAPQAALAPALAPLQAAPAASVPDAQLMTAAIAGHIRQTFSDLLSRPARLLDEPVTFGERAQAAPAAALAPVAQVAPVVAQAAPAAAPVAPAIRGFVANLAAQAAQAQAQAADARRLNLTPAAARVRAQIMAPAAQAAPRTAIVAPVAVQAAPADDWF